MKTTLQYTSKQRIFVILISVALLTWACQWLSRFNPQSAEPIQVNDKTFTVSIGGESITIVLEPPDDGDVSGLEITAIALGQGKMLVITDPTGRYLPEIRFLAPGEPDEIRIILMVASLTNYSLHVDHDVDIAALVGQPVGDTTLGELYNYLTPHAQNNCIGLLIAITEGVNESTAMKVYETPATGVFLALSADQAANAGTNSLIVLTFRGWPTLPIVSIVQEQLSETYVANLTGLSPKDIADLQTQAGVASGAAISASNFGEENVLKRFNSVQTSNIYKYVTSAKIVAQPCGSPEYEGKIFAVDPAPGSKVVPFKDKVILYLCNSVSAQQIKIVRIHFTGNPADCPSQQSIASAVDIVLVIDRSGSMSGSRLAAAKSSAIGFLARLEPATDRVGVVSFESDASIDQPLTSDFNAAYGAIASLVAEGGTAIHNGLNTAYDLLRRDMRPGVMPVILLLSDGQSDQAEALAAAAHIKAENIVLLTVGVGAGTDQGLMASLASAPTDYLFSNTNQGMHELFSTTAYRLKSGNVVARDVVIRVTVNTSHYAIIDSLLTHRGKVKAFGIVQWRIPVVYEGETITRPLAVRPLTAEAKAIGTLEISYNKCADGPRVALEPVKIQESDSKTITLSQEVIGAGVEKTGSLEEFGSQGWAMDLGKAGVYSVLVHGAGSELAPEIFAGNGQLGLYPLYTTVSGNDKIFTYFVKEPRLYWFYLQSNGKADSGSYSVNIIQGEAFTPRILQVNSGPLSDQIERDISNVYDLQGIAEGDMITVTIQSSGNQYIYPSLVSLDGEYNWRQYGFYPEQTRPGVYAIKVLGKGPYRLILDNYTDQTEGFTIQVEIGDLLAKPQGQITPGQTISGNLSTGRVDIWTFEGKAGEGISFTFQIQNPQEYEDYEIFIFDPEGTYVTDGWTEDEYQSGPIALTLDGTYTVAVKQSDYYDHETYYSLLLQNVVVPEPVINALIPSQTISSTVYPGVESNWVFEASAGQTAAITVKALGEMSWLSISLIGPDGEYIMESYSYSGQAQILPIELLDSGQYIVIVTGSGPDGDYEITLDLR